MVEGITSLNAGEKRCISWVASSGGLVLRWETMMKVLLHGVQLRIFRGARLAATRQEEG